jgi:hypothetical protein
LGALLRARRYDQFKDVYPTTPGAPKALDNRERTILYFSLADSQSNSEKPYIFDYTNSAPLAVWELEAAVRGVIQQVNWNGNPLPPLKPKSGIRGVLSGQAINDERNMGQVVVATVIVKSGRDKHEINRTVTNERGDFVLGLAPSKYIIEVRIPQIHQTFTRTIEVKNDGFTWVDAKFAAVPIS